MAAVSQKQQNLSFHKYRKPHFNFAHFLCHRLSYLYHFYFELNILTAYQQLHAAIGAAATTTTTTLSLSLVSLLVCWMLTWPPPQTKFNKFIMLRIGFSDQPKRKTRTTTAATANKHETHIWQALQPYSVPIRRLLTKFSFNAFEKCIAFCGLMFRFGSSFLLSLTSRPPFRVHFPFSFLYSMWSFGHSLIQWSIKTGPTPPVRSLHFATSSAAQYKNWM